MGRPGAGGHALGAAPHEPGGEGAGEVADRDRPRHRHLAPAARERTHDGVDHRPGLDHRAASDRRHAGERLGVAAGFIGVILAELLITPTGVGDLITYHRSVAEYAEMYAAIFSIIVFSAAMGVLWLSTVPLTSGLVAQMFGVRYMATLFGIVFLSHQLGSFLGVWLGGWIYDLNGSYNLMWWAGVILSLAAAVIHLPINEEPLPRERTEPGRTHASH